MKFKLSNELSVFLTLFAIWNISSFIIIFIRKWLFHQGLFPYDCAYNFIALASANQLVFVMVMIISFLVFSKHRPENCTQYTDKFLFHVNIVLLVVICIFNYIVLKKTGNVLTTGDYFSRWENKVSAFYLLVPHVLISLFYYNLAKNLTFNKKSYQIYGVLLCVASGCSVLAGSRSFVFLNLLFFLFLYLKYKKIVFDIRFAKKFVLIFFLIYVSGQVFNAVRWYAFNFSFLDFVLQFNSDSFPELRSYIDAIDKLGHNYGKTHFGFYNFILDMISRIVPEFVYSALGLERMDYYNSLWTKYLEDIIFGGVADFGIRLGLVGEIDLLLGFKWIVIMAVIYGYLITRQSFSIIYAVFLVKSVPYGLQSLYLLPVVISAVIIYEVIAAILQRRFYIEIGS